MLVRLSKNIPVQDPLNAPSFLNTLRHGAERYLYCGTQTATVEQTEGKFHRVKIDTHARTYSSIALTALKIVSYTSVILPLIALAVRTVLKIGHRYYYENPHGQEKDSAWIRAFKKKDLTLIKTLYTLDPKVLDTEITHPVYGKMTPFYTACAAESIPLLDWLLTTQGPGILTQLREGTSPLIFACQEEKPQTIQWLLKQETLTTTPNTSGQTCFEEVLNTLTESDNTTKILQSLYREGYGKGLFIKLCENNQLDTAKKLYKAIGQKILHETNQEGVNHIKHLCHTGCTKILDRLFTASDGAITSIDISPEECKGGTIKFVDERWPRS